MTKIYDLSMGTGLASSRNIPVGTKIVYFCGEILDVDSQEFSERVERGATDYMIELGEKFVMDCQYRKNICKACMINSWRKCAKPDRYGRPVPAEQNCKIVVDIANRIISIEAIRNIKRFEELFCEYGKGYGI